MSDHTLGQHRRAHRRAAWRAPAGRLADRRLARHPEARSGRDPRSPTAEAGALKALECGFESRRGYRGRAGNFRLTLSIDVPERGHRPSSRTAAAARTILRSQEGPLESRNPVFSNNKGFSRGGYATFRRPAPPSCRACTRRPPRRRSQTGRMTLDDVVVRTAALFAVLVAAAAAMYYVVKPGLPIVIGAAVVGMVLGLAVSFSKTVRPALILGLRGRRGGLRRRHQLLVRPGLRQPDRAAGGARHPGRVRHDARALQDRGGAQLAPVHPGAPDRRRVVPRLRPDQPGVRPVRRVERLQHRRPGDPHQRRGRRARLARSSCSTSTSSSRASATGCPSSTPGRRPSGSSSRWSGCTSRSCDSWRSCRTTADSSRRSGILGVVTIPTARGAVRWHPPRAVLDLLRLAAAGLLDPSLALALGLRARGR